MTLRMKLISFLYWKFILVIKLHPYKVMINWLVQLDTNKMVY